MHSLSNGVSLTGACSKGRSEGRGMNHLDNAHNFNGSEILMTSLHDRRF